MRITNSQVSFADLELQHQAVDFDQTLSTLSQFLDQHGELVSLVHQDLVRGLKNARTGRNGLTAEQVLRSFLLRRLKNWDYRELRERIADGFSLRLFTTFYSDPVPTYRAFHSAFRRLCPQTVRALNDAVVKAAVEMGLEDGTKLRVDTTVVQTDIHYPTDSSLLWDTVRVTTRLVKKLGQLLPDVTQGFHSRTRRARRRKLEIDRMEKSVRPRRMKRTYRDLVKVTQETVGKALEVAEKAANGVVTDLLAGLKVDAIRTELLAFCERGQRVIDQTSRRVFNGETVLAEEKILSVFEPHTDLIKRGKVQTPVEFGHKVFLAESAQGLITDYRVLCGNPTDDQQVEPSLERHRETFGAAPQLYAGDRGFYSQLNVQRCESAGVQEICLPHRGGAKSAELHAHQKSAPFKKGQRFRAGIEGRISVLMRGRGMKRCPDEGLERFEVFVGAAVLANNLLQIARLLKKKTTRRRVVRTRA